MPVNICRAVTGFGNYMEDTSVQFNLGTIDSHGGKLIFQLVVERDGSTYLNILAFEPTDATNSGIMSALGRCCISAP